MSGGRRGSQRPAGPGTAEAGGEEQRGKGSVPARVCSSCGTEQPSDVPECRRARWGSPEPVPSAPGCRAGMLLTRAASWRCWWCVAGQGGAEGAGGVRVLAAEVLSGWLVTLCTFSFHVEKVPTQLFPKILGGELGCLYFNSVWGRKKDIFLPFPICLNPQVCSLRVAVPCRGHPLRLTPAFRAPSWLLPWLRGCSGALLFPWIRTNRSNSAE